MPRLRPLPSILPLLVSSLFAAAAAADLSPADLRRLAAGETVVRMAPAPAVEGWAAQEVAVPAERVARAVGDWRHYAEFFPFVEESAAAVEGGAVVMKQVLDPPGLAPRRELVAEAHREGPAGEGGRRTWRFGWRERGGAGPRGKAAPPGESAQDGEWTLIELGPARTRIELRLAGDLGLPAALARQAVEKALPWVLDGLAQQVNRCRYDLPVHPTCGEAPAFAAPASP
jgi:hypothetical protein